MITTEKTKNLPPCEVYKPRPEIYYQYNASNSFVNTHRIRGTNGVLKPFSFSSNCLRTSQKNLPPCEVYKPRTGNLMPIYQESLSLHTMSIITAALKIKRRPENCYTESLHGFAAQPACQKKENITEENSYVKNITSKCSLVKGQFSPDKGSERGFSPSLETKSPYQNPKS
jgi:hypothetical protein